eukprot:TRINITY_DN47810_c0_g1_i1.p1 TRINITY_DN47810_c0_g1~~TRINITY_DN47810_c0_g1_i1.p1  ORF type:complete len:262 (+),score=18.75 TRINITY_DN47810_c0_g1_i1:34-819(+)
MAIKGGHRPFTQNKLAGLQSMHQKDSLTHNPNRAYTEVAGTPPPGNSIHLTAVEKVHGKKKVNLSASDPSPANVRRIMESSHRDRISTPGVDFGVEHLDNFYDEDAQQHATSEHQSGMPHLPSAVSLNTPDLSFLDKHATSPDGTSLDKGKRTTLPPVVHDHPDYSSTMALLQLTRKDVEAHAKDISAINSILTLPGSIELKRTIAKMFADPKNAEEISRHEWERKERKYEEDRNRQLQKQAEQLKKEREMLKQELAHLKT